MNKMFIKTCGLIILSIAVSACMNMPGIYKTDIKQGNDISDKRLARIVPGMTKDEVQFILGTPLVSDPFHTNIWYYTYLYHRSDGKKLDQRNAKVIFDNQNRVFRVE